LEEKFDRQEISRFSKTTCIMKIIQTFERILRIFLEVLLTLLVWFFFKKLFSDIQPRDVDIKISGRL